MQKKYYLGVDIGTTAIKAALFNENGQKVLHHAQEYNLIKPTAQRVEQVPSVYWDTFKTCVKKVMADSGINKEQVEAFAMDSSAETIVFLDEAMKPLDNFYVWMDSRAEEEAIQINTAFTPQQILHVTGQTPIDPVYPASKILWFKKHKREKFDKIRMMFMCDDYILWHMSGQSVSHGSSWCTSYLWDIVQKTWWPEMLEYLGISAQLLPEIRESGTPLGIILPEIADELGLPRDLLLVVGGQDQCAGAIGAGNVVPGIFSESTGGALMVCTTSDTPVFDDNACVPCNYSIIADSYMIQAGAKGGILLRWLRDTLCREEMDMEARGEGNAYDLMDQLAAATPAGAEGLFLMPFFGGAGSPHPDIFGRGALYGLNLGHTRGHIVRAFMEALACNISKMVEVIEELTGVQVTQIRSLGGGSLSPLWCQIKADVLDREVVTMENNQDAACLGAAILAGYGAGAWDSIPETALKFAKIAKIYYPNPENRKIYDRLLQKYDLFIQATKGFTEELSKLE